jgi:gas vesicle structural protein
MTDRHPDVMTEREVSLVEILDRALGAGIVISGDITISLADVDLVYLNLRLLLSSVGTILDGHDHASDPEPLSIGRRDDGSA